VSGWVLLIIIIAATLGLSRMSYAKAARVALVLTTMIVAYQMLRMGA
jgi:hypothetical protein